jgi:hypothetical protein
MYWCIGSQSFECRNKAICEICMVDAHEAMNRDYHNYSVMCFLLFAEPSDTAKVGMAVTSAGLNGLVRTGTGRRRGKRRGPWAYTTPEARSQKRKGKLREV